MKKLILVLLAAYIGVLAYMYYQKVQTNKIWNDPKWQYCLKVLYNINLPEPFDTFHSKWKRNLTVEVTGQPQQEDRNTIERVVQQLNELITPLKITVHQNLEKNKSVNFSNGSLNIDFAPKGKLFYSYNKKLFHDSVPSILFINNSTTETTFKESITKFLPSIVELHICEDTAYDQTHRSSLILKGLVYAVLCYYNQPHDEYLHKLDKNGHIQGISLNDSRFPKSVFNTSCRNCNELADVDKFIIKTYYSPDFEKTISDNSTDNYSKKFNLLSQISSYILYAIVLATFFSGFFHRYFFSFIENRIKNNWLAFNYKTFSIFIFFFIVSYTLLLVKDYIGHDNLSYSVVVLKKIYFPFLAFSTYIFLPINLIYLTEKIIFSRFDQFAKQQLFSFISLVTGILTATYLLGQWISPKNEENYLISIYVGAALGIIRFLYNYSNYQKKLAIIDKEQELTQLRELKTRAELNALQSKINPHFLYNALNSIAGLAHQNADKVEHMALALSRLFRYSINKDDDDFAKVQSEVEMVTIYLDIEKVRFGEKLEYGINVQQGLELERIPKFILQPLVENAIKHGLSQITGTGRLSVEIFKTGSNLCIRISDNGPDFPNDMMTGYGLQNIYEKLDILYPQRYEVTLQNGEHKNISVILKN
jgi:Putative regulator of cell autolysis